MNLIKVILTFLVLIIISSCKKTDNTKIDPESGIDYVQAESISTYLFQTVSNAIQYDTLTLKASNDSIPSCMHISNTPGGSNYPKTVTIYFDTTNASCSIGGVVYDGATYRGTITMQMSGPFKTTGSVITINPVNLYVNNNKVTGQSSITNLGRNTSDNLMFQMKVSNSIIYTKNGNIQYTFDKIWTWSNGESTDYPVIYDDIYQVTGTSNGININNSGFSTQTLSPLIIQLSCKGKIVKGKVQVIPLNAQTMTIDFGDSICAGKANMLIGNHSAIPITF